MSTIITKALQIQLKHEKERLLRDRDNIIAGAIEQATAEINVALHYIDALLGGETQKEAIDANTEASVSALNRATSNQSEDAPKRKYQRRRTEFDANNLKRKFHGQKQIDAIVQTMTETGTEIVFSVDQLIEHLYDPFNEADRPRARKSLASVLRHGVRRGLVDRVQDDPPQFRLKPTTGKSADAVPSDEVESELD